MTARLNQLRIATYNCRGLNNGKCTISDLLQLHDICFIQEHWLFNENLLEINLHNDFLHVGVSSMDSSVLLHGRPYGGCAILFRKSIISSVSMLQTDAKRFCAVSLSNQFGSTLLLICVYLPTASASPSSSTDFLVVLGEIEGFIGTQSYDNLLIVATVPE